MHSCIIGGAPLSVTFGIVAAMSDKQSNRLLPQEVLGLLSTVLLMPATGAAMLKQQTREPLFYRSFHLTVGGLFLLLPACIWITQGSRSSSWPLFAWVLFSFLPAIGTAFVLFGIIASDRKIASIRIVATDSAILMTMLAVPLYLILKSIRRNKCEQPTTRTHDRKP